MYFPLLCLFMLVFAPCVVCVFLLLAYIWGDLGGFHVVLLYFLDASLKSCCIVLRDFYMGVLGITHPWIGEKWPCGGGP